MVIRLLVLTVSIMIFTSTNASADIPRMINYQGVLTDASGDVISQASITINFMIYDDSLAIPHVWTESILTSITDGQISHNLGSIAPLPDTLFTRIDELFLEVQVIDTGGVTQILEPRTRLVSSGYAFRVSTIDSASGGTVTGEVSILNNSDNYTLTVNNDGYGGGGHFQIHGLANANAAVYGISEAGEDMACAIHGVLTGETAGWESAAIKGENYGEGLSGAGVFGLHYGGGYGVHGKGEGEGANGVWGYAETGIGIHGTSLYDKSGYFSGGRVQIIGGTDASVIDNTSGMLVVGVTSYENIVMDKNEIMARNGGAVSTLHLQTDGGTVAIGLQGITPPAGYVLAVDGKAVMEEVEVQLSQDWPDYVFDDDYRLTPLDELADEIKENGHLPGMPSAHEAESNGIALGEMQTLLLTKVEELTLHLIAMDQRVKNLNNENEILKKQLSKYMSPNENENKDGVK
ncbi:MAG: hypothetical protein GY841_07885 [FCB group bacterium]|nr:hypothetical protein [FCB group bacterium]